MMCRVIFPICLLLLVSRAAAADEFPAAAPANGPISESIAQIPLNQTSAPQLTYCCNQEAAVVGAAVGGAIGWYLGMASADGSNRNMQVLAVTGVMAALGAAVGAHVRPPQHRFFPSRVAIAPAVTKTAQAGVVSVSF